MFPFQNATKTTSAGAPLQTHYRKEAYSALRFSSCAWRRRGNERTFYYAADLDQKQVMKHWWRRQRLKRQFSNSQGGFRRQSRVNLNIYSTSEVPVLSTGQYRLTLSPSLNTSLVPVFLFNFNRSSESWIILETANSTTCRNLYIYLLSRECKVVNKAV